MVGDGEGRGWGRGEGFSGLTTVPAGLYAIVDVLVGLALDAADDEAREVGVQILLHLRLLHGGLGVSEQPLVSGGVVAALDGAARDLDIGGLGGPRGGQLGGERLDLGLRSRQGVVRRGKLLL